MEESIVFINRQIFDLNLKIETNNEYQKMYDLFEIFSDYKFTDDTKRNIARKCLLTQI